MPHSGAEEGKPSAKSPEDCYISVQQRVGGSLPIMTWWSSLLIPVFPVNDEVF